MKRKTKLAILVILYLIIFSTSAYGESSISIFDNTITVGNNDDPENYVFSLQLYSC